MSFKKFDQGKADWSLMPEPALVEVLKVLMLGRDKYGSWNWLENNKDVCWSRYTNALERHFKKFKCGQDLDEETGLEELAHVIANALFLLTYRINGFGIDDRRKEWQKLKS